MTARGLDPGTVAAAIRACQDPGFAFMSQVTMAAWGRPDEAMGVTPTR
jgi:hypothetical protein